MIEVNKLAIEQGAFALQDVSFTVPDGAYAVLMGKSGCGKTTIVEAICGLRPVVSGSIHLGDRDITHVRPAERNIAYVPQDVALFPTFKVRDQLAFSLVVREAEDSFIAERVELLAERLAIEHLLDRMPQGLSGGEAKRVALGRALVPQPEVICLDEPLSNLDEDTAADMLALLETALKAQNVTVLHVTHSSREADQLADLTLRLDGGSVLSL